jgi:hypothetical protein
MYFEFDLELNIYAIMYCPIILRCLASCASGMKDRPLFGAANVSLISLRIHNSATVLLFDLPCYALLV